MEFPTPPLTTVFFKEGKLRECSMKTMPEHTWGLSPTWAGKAISSEPFRAGTSVGAWGIYTLSIDATLVGSIRTFVQVCMPREESDQVQKQKWDI